MAVTIEDKDLKMEREVKEFQQLCSQYTKSTANITHIQWALEQWCHR